MLKLDSDLKDYFTIEERIKVKIKNKQYSAIVLHLFFVLKIIFLRTEAWASAEWVGQGRFVTS